MKDLVAYEYGIGKVKEDLFKELQDILAFPLKLSTLVVSYYFSSLLVDWSELIQPQRMSSNSKSSSPCKEAFIECFLQTLENLDTNNPYQIQVVQIKIMKRPVTPKDYSKILKIFPNNNQILKFLLSKGLEYYRMDCLQLPDSVYRFEDMIRDMDLEEKSRELSKKTWLSVDDSKEFILEKSDLLYLLGKIFSETGYSGRSFAEFSCFRGENTPYFSEEKEGKYSLITFPNTTLLELVSNLPILKQEFMEFEEYKAGGITFDLIDNLFLFPTVICQMICYYLYEDFTISKLAKKTVNILDEIDKIVFFTDKEAYLSLYCLNLRKTLKAISDQKSLYILEDDCWEKLYYYPNPLKTLAYLYEGHFKIGNLKRKLFLNELIRQFKELTLIAKLAEQFEINMIQIINFSKAYTSNSSKQSKSSTVLPTDTRFSLFAWDFSEKQRQIRSKIEARGSGLAH